MPAESLSKLKKALKFHILFHSDRSKCNTFSFTLGKIFQYNALRMVAINPTIIVKTCQMFLSSSDVNMSNGIQLQDIQLPILKSRSTWCHQYSYLAWGSSEFPDNEYAFMLYYDRKQKIIKSWQKCVYCCSFKCVRAASDAHLWWRLKT